MSAVNYNGSVPFLTFKTCLVSAFGVLVLGLSALLLVSVCDFLHLYAHQVAQVLFVAFVILVIFACAYIAFSLWLSIEYRAIQNERFKNDNVELLARVPFSDPATNDRELDILEAYNQLIESGEFSLNRLALLVFGKKGGTYNAQIKQVLLDNDIYV